MTDTSTTTVQTTGSGGGSALVSERGRTTIADAVVAKIAGIAAREIAGVHNMGSGTARAVGALRERLPGAARSSITQGVNVEVGERQAAVDVDIVCEYGVRIVDVANAVRRNITERIEDMTGLEVTEVNIAVDDVFTGEDRQEEPQPERVQ
ncbi:MAG: Asp23/Gls24 family envelope stress response protein [Actinobacteria bacterium]|nr:Asp23/Gls24 family envelope stress response protein [Actinomycetota bacterium]MBW3642657.1 Asp23/Gls24 family envelope stress response protein [Actinomycetota bacterium]